MHFEMRPSNYGDKLVIFYNGGGKYETDCLNSNEKEILGIDMLSAAIDLLAKHRSHNELCELFNTHFDDKN